MTTDEWIDNISRHIAHRNCNGVLVCCDGLQENGDEEMANTLRWMVRRFDTGLHFGMIHYLRWQAQFAGGLSFTENTLPELIKTLANYRLWMQEFVK